MNFKPSEIDHITRILAEVDPLIKENTLSMYHNTDLLIEELTSLYALPDFNSTLKILIFHKKNGSPFDALSFKSSIEQYYNINRKAISIFRYYIFSDLFFAESIKVGNILFEKVNDGNSVVERIRNNNENLFSNRITDEDLNNSLQFPMVCAKVYAPTPKDAYEKFYKGYSLIKGISEYSYNRGKWKSSIGEPARRSFSIFSHPLFVFEVADSSANIYAYDTTFLPKLKIAKRDSEKDIEIASTLTIFKKEHKHRNIIDIIGKCFRLYDSAISHPYKELSFRLYWNLLEEITNSLSFKGNSDKVIERSLKLIGKGIEESYPGIIKELPKIRNKSVHQGIDEIRDVHVNFMKYLSEHSIKILMGQRDLLGDENTLGLYYEMIYKSEEDQKLSLDILKRILKMD